LSVQAQAACVPAIRVLALTGIVALASVAVTHAGETAASAEKPKSGMSAAQGEKPGGMSAPTAAKESMKPAEPATPSIKVGEKAPDFTLTDTDGKKHTLSDYAKAGKIVVLEWFNPDCPFIKKHHTKATTMNDLAAEQQKKDVVWLAINSGAPGKQGAGLERNKAAKTEYKMNYPILLDEAGTVGRMYGAKTTPHMFVIAKDGTLIYKGAIDDDKSPDKVGATLYVRTAVNSYAAGEKVEPSETTSYGCSVKYGDK
jgi:peroxiredoxin